MPSKRRLLLWKKVKHHGIFFITITLGFLFLSEGIFLVASHTKSHHTPVWEDLTWWPSGAWSRATNPLLGACFKSSPPKLNFSSAFCQTDEWKGNLYGAHLTSVSLFSNLILMKYLEHAGGKEGLILQMLRDLKSQTQVITWRKETKRMGQKTWVTFSFLILTFNKHDVKNHNYWDSTIFRERNLALV